MRLKRFLQFVNENINPPKLTVPLQFSNRFLATLGEPGFGIISPIKDALLDLRLTPQDMSLIDIGKEPDTASFTTAYKLSQHFYTKSQVALNDYVTPLTREDWEVYHTNRSDIKIGRLIKKLLLDTFSDSEVEKFVNQYKSILNRDAFNFKVYRGFDIKTGYISRRYTNFGHWSNPLMNSCMNDCMGWLDFYDGCPAFLLVLLNEEDHIFGRALVWNIGGGKYLMDRVYVAFENDYYQFIDYAKKNQWWWKSENKSNPETPYTNGASTKWFPIEVSLNFDFEKEKDLGVPFLDTFCYAQGRKLMNYVPKSGNYCKLQETDGSCAEFEDADYKEL